MNDDDVCCKLSLLLYIFLVYYILVVNTNKNIELYNDCQLIKY
jgi:hypothetical protein